MAKRTKANGRARLPGVREANRLRRPRLVALLRNVADRLERTGKGRVRLWDEGEGADRYSEYDDLSDAFFRACCEVGDDVGRGRLWPSYDLKEIGGAVMEAQQTMVVCEPIGTPTAGRDLLTAERDVQEVILCSDEWHNAVHAGMSGDEAYAEAKGKLYAVADLTRSNTLGFQGQILAAKRLKGIRSARGAAARAVMRSAAYRNAISAGHGHNALDLAAREIYGNAGVDFPLNVVGVEAHVEAVRKIKAVVDAGG